jgi:hypothetical protein
VALALAVSRQFASTEKELIDADPEKFSSVQYNIAPGVSSVIHAGSVPQPVPVAVCVSEYAPFALLSVSNDIVPL